MLRSKFTLLLLLSLGLLGNSLLSCLNTSADLTLINGQNVMQHIKNIVSYGPHPAGSDAQKKVAQYLVQQMSSLGLKVHTHPFRPITPQGRLEMQNIWGVIKGDQESVIILASHYDSKYFENFSFIGANDSGSSSGLLLELARILSNNNPTNHSLWIVFFDGEESLHEWTRIDSLYGSREFVKTLKRKGNLEKISTLILLDMVGDKNLQLFQDLNSSKWLNRIIWNKASQMGHGKIFVKRGNVAAEDDHLPFAREGVPVVDVINLNYKYWHRKEDTLDKLSTHNLTAVGNVILSSLAEISQSLEH